MIKKKKGTSLRNEILRTPWHTTKHKGGKPNISTEKKKQNIDVSNNTLDVLTPINIKKNKHKRKCKKKKYKKESMHTKLEKET